MFLLGLAVTAALLHGRTAYDVVHGAALGVGVSLVLSLLTESRAGVRALIRPDLVMLASLYYLTLFEFLFPQSGINDVLSEEVARKGCWICLLAFTGLAVGRHWGVARNAPGTLLRQHIPLRWVLRTFWLAMTFGYFHMLLAVNFNPVEMVSHFFGARFSAPWSRGRYGDWLALLNEIGALLFLVPPLAGVILARRRKFTRTQICYVAAGLLLTLAYGFCGGTRFIFGAYLITFLAGFAVASPGRSTRTLIWLGAAAATLMLLHTTMALEFRQIGMKQYYAHGSTRTETQQHEFIVDRNIVPISIVADVFPEKKGYLGLELPIWFLVRPIPRALWPGKPIGLSVTGADLMGVNNATVTIAMTFVGEAYICRGPPMVLLVSAGLGALAGWWSRLASRGLSEMGVVVYASGFYAAAVSMRSVQELPVIILPTAGAATLVWLLSRRNGSQSYRS